MKKIVTAIILSLVFLFTGCSALVEEFMVEFENAVNENASQVTQGATNESDSTAQNSGVTQSENETAEQSTNEVQTYTDATTSPLPNDTELVLSDLYTYMEIPEELLSEFNGEIQRNNPDVVNAVLQDWLDEKIIDVNMFEPLNDGVYSIVGYFWNDYSQVEEHVERIFGTAAPASAKADAVDFFTSNEVRNLTVPCDVIFGLMTAFVTNGSSIEHYFSNEAGVVFRFAGAYYNGFGNTLDEVLSRSSDGTLSGFMANNTEDIAVIDLENNIIMTYATHEDDAGVYEHLSIYNISTEATSYESGQSEPITLDVSGVSILTNDTGIRMIGTIEDKAILELSGF